MWMYWYYTHLYTYHLFLPVWFIPLYRHSRMNLWTPVTKDEMKVVIALMIAMGLTEKSDLDAYWSTEEVLETPFFPRYMRRAVWPSRWETFPRRDSSPARRCQAESHACLLCLQRTQQGQSRLQEAQGNAIHVSSMREADVHHPMLWGPSPVITRAKIIMTTLTLSHGRKNSECSSGTLLLCLRLFRNYCC